MRQLTAIALLALAFMTGCATTTVKTNWKDPAVTSISFKKVVVVVINSTPGQRRAQEDVIVEQIKSTTAVASYSLVPDDQLKDVNKARQTIAAAGFDGAMVVHLLGKKEVTTFNPGSSWNDPWNYGYGTQSYSYTDTYVNAEISLYSVTTGKLIWSGTSESINPSDERAFAKQVAAATAKELRKQGLLPPE